MCTGKKSSFTRFHIPVVTKDNAELLINLIHEVNVHTSASVQDLLGRSVHHVDLNLS